MSRLHHRHAERLPRTALAAAFLEALRRWALKHHAGVGTRIVIPAATVSATELRQLVFALLMVREDQKAKRRAVARRGEGAQ